jgi:hypothetical protein
LGQRPRWVALNPRGEKREKKEVKFSLFLSSPEAIDAEVKGGLASRDLR